MKTRTFLVQGKGLDMRSSECCQLSVNISGLNAQSKDFDQKIYNIFNFIFTKKLARKQEWNIIYFLQKKEKKKKCHVSAGTQNNSQAIVSHGCHSHQNWKTCVTVTIATQKFLIGPGSTCVGSIDTCGLKVVPIIQVRKQLCGNIYQ